MEKQEKQKEEIGYAAAVKEIEAILAKMNDPGLDVDALSGYVERAMALIADCRHRLLVAQEKLSKEKLSKSE